MQKTKKKRLRYLWIIWLVLLKSLNLLKEWMRGQMNKAIMVVLMREMKKGTMLVLMLMGQMKKGTMLVLILVRQMKKSGCWFCCRRRNTARGRWWCCSVGVGTFNTYQSTDNHEIDPTYSIDELDGDVDIDDGEGVRRCPVFWGEEMYKEFKFKLGMEFFSLKHFKQALMEHSILNGRDIKFIKNDDVRVRAICKRKCGFLILCSKVRGSQTFRVKTLFDRYNCGGIFGNKNTNKE